MSKCNRQTLKAYFSQGKRPSESDFADLIDSAANIVEDSLYRTPEAGVVLVPEQGNEALLSVFRGPGDPDSLWRLTLDRISGNLKLEGAAAEGCVTLAEFRQASGPASAPEVSVAGIHCSPGRKGTFASGTVPADGRWHDITANLGGCRVLEVTAGWGLREKGQYAVLTALAAGCCGKRLRIREITSRCGRRGCRLRLQWVRQGEGGILRLKTRSGFGSKAVISFHISAMWDDPFMERI